jgi:uncharacterized protein (TIGR00730 family)
MIKKINLGIIGGHIIIDDNSLVNNIKCIGNNLNINKFKIYYGGNTGLMNLIPSRFYKSGGIVSSINWSGFKEDRTNIGEEIVYDKFRDRQYYLLKNCEMFLCLPGGIGTLSELIDIVLYNSDFYREHPRLIIIYNYKGFYDVFEHMLSVILNRKYGTTINLDTIIYCKTYEEIIKILKELE